MRFEAIGTTWQIDTPRPLAPSLERSILARVDAFDRTYSRFRDDSLVADIARRAGVFRFPDDAGPLFDLYRRLYAVTKGRVTPLVGRALEELGYDSSYSLRPTARRTAVPSWDEAFAWDGETLSTARPVTVDVGAAGKGYLVDLIDELLRADGVEESTIDASGDIRHTGAPIRVALEHPADRSRAIGVVTLEDGAICASATNRRAWGEGLHHVVDGITGLPTQNVIATWAIAATALEADGISTALFFTGPEYLAAEFDFTYVRMYSTGRVEYSPRLQGEIFA